jgi:hypothetical protein
MEVAVVLLSSEQQPSSYLAGTPTYSYGEEKKTPDQRTRSQPVSSSYHLETGSKATDPHLKPLPPTPNHRFSPVIFWVHERGGQG